MEIIIASRSRHIAPVDGTTVPSTQVEMQTSLAVTVLITHRIATHRLEHTNAISRPTRTSSNRRVNRLRVLPVQDRVQLESPSGQHHQNDKIGSSHRMIRIKHIEKTLILAIPALIPAPIPLQPHQDVERILASHLINRSPLVPPNVAVQVAVVLHLETKKIVSTRVSLPTYQFTYPRVYISLLVVGGRRVRVVRLGNCAIVARGTEDHGRSLVADIVDGVLQDLGADTVAVGEAVRLSNLAEGAPSVRLSVIPLRECGGEGEEVGGEESEKGVHGCVLVIDEHKVAKCDGLSGLVCSVVVLLFQGQEKLLSVCWSTAKWLRGLFQIIQRNQIGKNG